MNKIWPRAKTDDIFGWTRWSPKATSEQRCQHVSGQQLVSHLQVPGVRRACSFSIAARVAQPKPNPGPKSPNRNSLSLSLCRPQRSTDKRGLVSARKVCLYLLIAPLSGRVCSLFLANFPQDSIQGFSSRLFSLRIFGYRNFQESILRRLFKCVFAVSCLLKFVVLVASSLLLKPGFVAIQKQGSVFLIWL